MPISPALSKPQTLAVTSPIAEGLSKLDIYSIVVTLTMGIGLGILASFSAHYSKYIWLAVSVGGLGGLVHEIAQSGGKILFFERKLDGIYIGSLAGTILGAVAGLLAIRGLIINPPTPPDITQLIYEGFLAGLALKGITEAAGGQALPQGSDSVSPAQAMAAEASLNQIVSGPPASPLAATTAFHTAFPPPPATLPPGF
jgi:hypothetical protein